MAHPTHKTRFSDSSFYDEVCTLCGKTDSNGMEELDKPCSPRVLYSSPGEVVKGLDICPICERSIDARLDPEVVYSHNEWYHGPCYINTEELRRTHGKES